MSKDYTLQDVSQMVFNLVHGKRKMNLLQAYSRVHTKSGTNYSYDEVKDYLFNHTLKVTE